MERSKEDLLQEILALDTAPAEIEDSRALAVAAEARPPVVAAMLALRPLVPEEEEDELAEYYRFALLGLSVGFAERNLSPQDPAHQAIVQPLLADIRSVYKQLGELGSGYDREEFLFRAYDYGVHKAYYLDWRLYLSQELY